MIRVVVADDHRVVRAGLETLLASASDIEVVGSVADGAGAVSAAAELHPDVILMDLSMPGVDGIEATRRIMAEHPEMKVIVLTSFAERSRVLDAVGAGAVGYLLKDAEPEELLDAIKAAHRGGAPLDPRVASALLPERKSASSDDVALTARERQVLALIGEGLQNKQIARRLGISEKTVKAHLTNVFQRIGVTDRTRAALWAQRHGIADGAPR